MTLPTFLPDAKCPQCGHDEIGVTYLDDTTHTCQTTYAPLPYKGARPVCHYYSGPHFHRTCRRCGYRWGEAVRAPSMAYYPEQIGDLNE